MSAITSPGVSFDETKKNTFRGAYEYEDLKLY